MAVALKRVPHLRPGQTPASAAASGVRRPEVAARRHGRFPADGQAAAISVERIAASDVYLKATMLLPEGSWQWISGSKRLYSATGAAGDRGRTEPRVEEK